jgi:hypothetical protein
MTKTCVKCGIEKPLTEFHKNKKCRRGVDNRCKSCKNQIKREYDALNETKQMGVEYRKGEVYKAGRARQAQARADRRKDKAEQNRIAAGEMFLSRVDALARGLTRYNEGVMCKRGHRGERSTANNQCLDCVALKRLCPDYKAMKAGYHQTNRSHMMAKNIENQRRRYATDPSYKAAVAARNMLKRVLAAGQNRKVGRSSTLLGYTGIELMDYMTSLFTDGMSWSNYGDWHIDHIRPVSLFVAEGVTDPAIVNALSNLQPLWAEDNFAKRNKFDNP